MDIELSTATTQKDKEILPKIVVKAQKEFFYPTMTKLLQTYMKFAIDSSDFSQTLLQKIVICKNNNMHTLLITMFNLPILKSSQENKVNLLF